ncbi:hypothetical protein HMPREF1870_01530 [Bacteroidales bacterium KA00344]|nr:hypothetical protein HMPREF1870_01530 [Bacteroidales bacterium KA00344]
MQIGRYDVGIIHSSLSILQSPPLHFSFYKILLPFFGHYFRVIQRKKSYLFSSKPD